MDYIIYKINLNTTYKCYIGYHDTTKSIDEIFDMHKAKAKAGRANIYLYDVLRKEGFDKFEIVRVKTLKNVSREEVLKVVEELKNVTQSYFNFTPKQVEHFENFKNIENEEPEKLKGLEEKYKCLVVWNREKRCYVTHTNEKPKYYKIEV